MASLPLNATPDQVEEELDFTDVLISSLDEGADDYAERLAELESTKAELEQRLEVLLSGSSQSQTIQDQSQEQQTGMDSDFERPSWWLLPPAEEDATDSDSTQNGLSTHGRSFDNISGGMKRPLPDSLRLESQHVSKRPTPEPSRVGTPLSLVDSIESQDAANADFNPRASVRQRMIEADLQRKHDREVADKELALNLDHQQMQPRAIGAASSSQQRNTFQTTLGFDGSFQRPPPSSQSSSSQPPAPKTSDSFGSHAFPNGHPSTLGAFGKMARQPYGKPAPNPFIKPEPGFVKREQPSHPRLPAEVVDLTGSDDEDEELTVVSSNGFTPNNRLPRPTMSNPLALRPMQQQTPSYLSMPGSFPITPQTQPANGYQPSYTLPSIQQAVNPNGYQSVYGNANSVNFPMQTVHQAGNPLLNGAINGARNLARNVLTPFASLPSPLPSWNRESGEEDLLFVGSQQRDPTQPLPYAGYADRDLYNRRYNELADYNPEKTKEEINALLENIRPDEDIPADLRVKTPEAMSIKLHKYQELGLTWLKQSEEGKNKGGILGDEMGLGKTIQMLSLIVERKADDPRCKGTLIVAPVALMRQWRQEIEQKIKPGRHRLSVFVHHQTAKKKSFADLQPYDIVLTTYGTLSSEFRKMEKFHVRKHNDPNARLLPSEKCVIIGDDARWYRVVLDEAQCIKNKSTLAHRAACLINAKYRFCMTGTPMMNNVEEFFSLVKFLNIRPYCKWEKFKVDINSPLKSYHEDARHAAMVKLQALCKAIMLRRTKKSTFEGKPILVLPERTTEVENPEFDDDERAFYNAIEQKQRLQFNKYLKAGEVGNHYSAILVLLLRLRQAACHPHLIKDFGIAAAADITQEEVLNFAETLEPQVVERIKATGGNFECPVCYDAVSNPAIFVPCGHDTCRECFTRITDPSDDLRNGNENGGGAKCPNCRGPIDTKRVTDFDAFKKVHMPELLTREEQMELERIKKEEDGSDSDSESDEDDDEDEDEDDVNDVDAKGNLKGFIVNDDDPIKEGEDSDNDDEEVNIKDEEVEEGDGDAGPSRGFSKVNGGKSKSTKASGKAKSKGKGKGPKLPRKKKEKKAKRNQAVTLAELAKLSQRNAKARKTYLRRLRENYQDSAKIRKTMELLEGIMKDPEGEKVLIFSQWTSLLDLLEIPVDGQGWGYRRYDGSMNAKQRGDAVDDFRDHKQNIRLMLVSLKAGNAGLNLNMASQVIILDPFWNPYIEEQAIDRAHRIGQSRPVKVHRVLVAETVEDRIIQLQEKKRALISEALDEKAGQNIARLGVQELAYLFGVTRNSNERVAYVPVNRR